MDRSGGEDCYTTEIVLNRFRGQLTMLDSARGAGGPPTEDGYDEGTAAVLMTSRRRAAPSSRPAPAPWSMISTTTSCFKSQPEDRTMEAKVL
jgi:hypothetical protein